MSEREDALMKLLEAQDAKLAAQGEQIAALAAQLNPPKGDYSGMPTRRYDPTEGFTLPPSVRAEMAAVGDATMSGVVCDARRAAAKPEPTPTRGHVPVVGNGRGWVDARPLPTAPPGQNYMDGIMDHADAVDRAELVRKAALKGGG